MIIPIKGALPPDPLDDFSDLHSDVRGLSDHELQLTLGAVKPPRLPYRAVHPVAGQFSGMGDAEYRALVEDIRRNGQRKAICMYQGMIWDGRARYDACVDLGLVPKVWALRRGDPVIYLLQRHGIRYGTPSSPERESALRLLRQIDAQEWKDKIKKQRSEWIAEARSDFDRGWRSPHPCAVCGLLAEYSHAHHSLPLGLQYELGVDNAVQELDWLCPVHHKLIHTYISARLLGTRWSEGPDFSYRYPNDEARRKARDAVEGIFAKAHRLFTDVGGVATAGNWAMLRP